MGCDIHMAVERRKANGTWEYMQGPKDKYGRTDYYNGRSYFLFSLLADVRNRGRVVPFSRPRGTPDDISAETRKRIDSWAGDGHSHSYFTIKELLDFNWDKTTEVEEYITLPAYVSWKDKSKAPEHPYRFNAGAMGDELLTMEEADKFLKTNLGLAAEVLEQNYAVRAKWDMPYRHYCGEFFRAIDEILKLDDDPDNLRIVFWFDN